MIPTEEETKEYNTSVEKLVQNELVERKALDLGNFYFNQYVSVLHQAKNENRQVLLCFYIDKCPACTVFKYLLLYSQKIKNILQEKNYILFKQNMSEAKNNLPDKYNVYRFPAYILIDCHEKVLKSGSGYFVGDNPENYILNWLQN